jgi:hypothetical protein
MVCKLPKLYSGVLVFLKNHGLTLSSTSSSLLSLLLSAPPPPPSPAMCRALTTPAPPLCAPRASLAPRPPLTRPRWPLLALPRCSATRPNCSPPPLTVVAARPAPPPVPGSPHALLPGQSPPWFSPLSSSARATLPRPCPSSARGRHARRQPLAPALACCAISST